MLIIKSSNRPTAMHFCILLMSWAKKKLLNGFLLALNYSLLNVQQFFEHFSFELILCVRNFVQYSIIILSNYFILFFAFFSSPF